MTGAIHGCCFEVLPRLRCAVDCVFVDPPYNLGFDYGNGRAADRLPAAEHVRRMERLFDLCVGLLSETGSIWVLSPERWADDIGTMLSARLPRRNRIIWRETFGQCREDRFPSGSRHLFWPVATG